MIHITQGHEDGIGIEVFLKSLLYFEQQHLNKFQFYCNQSSLEKTIKTLPHHFELKGSKLHFYNRCINIILIEDGPYQSSASLQSALKKIREHDTLFTLPTSKDQLLLNRENKLGYTEYLRSYFSKDEIAMCFKSGTHITALLTDHISLAQVPTKLSQNYIEAKANQIIDDVTKHFFTPSEIIFTGVNPHSGENGRLGHEDKLIEETINILLKKYSKLRILPRPVPADTAHFYLKPDEKQLFIYAYHDQALTIYKKRFGLLGINVTLGLPFKRMSVDHGTAFDLFGKNLADSSGCLYCLNEAIKWDSHDG